MSGMRKRERQTRGAWSGEWGVRERTSLSPCLRISLSPTPHSPLPTPLVPLSFIRSIHESIFDQGPDGRETVAPGDFLAFRKIAAIIRDRHLVEFVFALEDFGGDLRLEIEAVRPDLEVFDHVGAEDFVTGLHIRENRVVKQIGDEREHLVADEMPEVESPRHLG